MATLSLATDASMSQAADTSMSLAADTSVERVTRYRSEGNFYEYVKHSRKVHRFIDVYIKAGNNTFPAHRLVLACYSQFLRGCFKLL